ncbi:MAG TPA: hypothetical protein VGP33_17815, partial [Chloroflexota bacterium]|nr:hypothetical protein [Chloroflexota bacterium]
MTNASANLPEQVAGNAGRMFGPKSPQSAPTAQCVPGILLELQEGRNALAAVLRFLERSWQRSIADARRNPALLR